MVDAPGDTWLGTPFSDAEAVAMAEQCGFEPRYRIGAETQYFWLWYFRRSWWNKWWKSFRRCYLNKD
jgi:hypothetical protein